MKFSGSIDFSPWEKVPRREQILDPYLRPYHLTQNDQTWHSNRCANGCVVVPDLQSGGCRFKFRPGLHRTKVYSAFHPSWVSKWVPTAAGKANACMYSSFH